MQECPGGNITNLSPGFWRISNETDSIYECYNNKEVCIGGTDNNICLHGHIGPLCEQCDLYGELGP